MKKLSITTIIPIYNVEQYLDKCLESIEKQSEKFDEVILINDGSTDKSSSICEEYCKRNSYFKLINQENQGQGIARNIGIKQAISDYIIFIDADDYIDINLVSIVKKNLKKIYTEVLFYSAKIRYDINYGMISNTYVRKKSLCRGVRTGIKFLEDSFDDNYIVSPCLAVYKRDLILKNEIFFPKGIIYEDNVFFLKILMKAESVSCIEDELYIRRVRSGSTTISKITLKKCRDMIKVVMLQWQILKLETNFKPNFIRRFVTRTMVNVIQMLDVVEEQELILIEKEQLTKLFFNYWGNLFNEKTEDWCETGIFLFLCKEKLNNDDSIYFSIEKIEKKFFIQLKKWIERIPFNNSNLKIAVYGIGAHTEKLLYLYEKVCGNINCDFYYLVTRKERQSEFKGKKLVSTNEIDHDTDYVVISSLIYQEEMIEELDKKNILPNNRIILYRKNEIYDLVVLSKIIEKTIPLDIPE